MLFSKTIKEKLDEWFNEELFIKEILQYSDEIKIEEKTQSGEALVYFRSNGKNAFLLREKNQEINI